MVRSLSWYKFNTLTVMAKDLWAKQEAGIFRKPQHLAGAKTNLNVASPLLTFGVSPSAVGSLDWDTAFPFQSLSVLVSFRNKFLKS